MIITKDLLEARINQYKAQIDKEVLEAEKTIAALNGAIGVCMGLIDLLEREENDATLEQESEES